MISKLASLKPCHDVNLLALIVSNHSLADYGATFTVSRKLGRRMLMSWHKHMLERQAG